MAIVPLIYFVSFTDRHGRTRKFGPFSERKIAQDVRSAISSILHLEPLSPAISIEEMALNVDFTFEHNGSTIAIEV